MIDQTVATVTAPFQVSDDGENDQSKPAIQVTDEGEIYIGWLSPQSGHAIRQISEAGLIVQGGAYSAGAVFNDFHLRKDGTIRLYQPYDVTLPVPHTPANADFSYLGDGALARVTGQELSRLDDDTYGLLSYVTEEIGGGWHLALTIGSADSFRGASGVTEAQTVILRPEIGPGEKLYNIELVKLGNGNLAALLFVGFHPQRGWDEYFMRVYEFPEGTPEPGALKLKGAYDAGSEISVDLSNYIDINQMEDITYSWQRTGDGQVVSTGAGYMLPPELLGEEASFTVTLSWTDRDGLRQTQLEAFTFEVQPAPNALDGTEGSENLYPSSDAIDLIYGMGGTTSSWRATTAPAAPPSIIRSMPAMGRTGSISRCNAAMT